MSYLVYSFIIGKTKCDNVYIELLILNAFASHFESAYTVSNDSDERVEPIDLN
jgi:hypothetical protein